MSEVIPTSTPPTHYDVLEVSQKARPSVIRAAWVALSKEYPEYDDRRIRINVAHDELEDEAKRATYDESLSPASKRKKVVRVGQYQLIKQIGEGGCAKTYLARHALADWLVCIKHCELASDADRAIMLDEARALSKLSHHCLPAVRDVIELPDRTIAIAMSYVPGENLQQLVERTGGLDPEVLFSIAERILNALCYIHYNGSLHGDVKPANIILAEKEVKHTAMATSPHAHNYSHVHEAALVDFGLAIVDPDRTKAKGYTKLFAAPEQLAYAPLMPQTDLYCFGLTLIYALGGDVRRRKVPESTPDAVVDFIRRLTEPNILKRPSWENENLLDTIGDVRVQAFKRRSSRIELPGARR
jgi:serine/threonine protein kinase